MWKVSSIVGGSIWIAWKRRSSERSFSMYLRYSLSVVAPMQEISPRDSAGLRMLAASSEPSADPAPIREWISSMKTMRSGLSRSSLRIPFEPLLELAAVLGAGDHQRQVERDHPLLRQRRPARCRSTMRWARPSTMAVLPTPGSPSRIGLFLVRRDRIWMMRSSSFSPSDQRIEGALGGERGQVAAVLGEERELLLLLRRFLFLVDARHLLANRLHVEAVLVRGCAWRGSLRPGGCRGGGAPSPPPGGAWSPPRARRRPAPSSIPRRAEARRSTRCARRTPVRLRSRAESRRALRGRRRNNSLTVSSPSRRMPSRMCSDSITRLPSLDAS